MQQRRFLRRSEAAELLGIPERTLRSYDALPAFQKIVVKVPGIRMVRYDRDALENWLESNTLEAQSQQ